MYCAWFYCNIENFWMFEKFESKTKTKKCIIKVHTFHLKLSCNDWFVIGGKTSCRLRIQVSRTYLNWKYIFVVFKVFWWYELHFETQLKIEFLLLFFIITKAPSFLYFDFKCFEFVLKRYLKINSGKVLSSWRGY